MEGNSGNGKMIDLLERIAAGIDGNNERVDGINQRLDGLAQRVDGVTERLDVLTDRVDVLNDRMDRLSDRVDRGFATVNVRLDNVLVFMGRRHGDHEQRIQALEKSVFKKRKPD